nr:YneF family protein [Vagococcus allomyrinae]
MSTGYVILIAIIALALGAVGGFFLARKYMEDYLKKNPPVNEDMLRMMMMQMGQKPSEKKIRQMMQNMKNQAGKPEKK